MSAYKTSETPESLEPVRRYTHPEPGEGWEEIAARVGVTDVATLQSWNLHLAMRPPPISLTPVDIVFVVPPRAEGGRRGRRPGNAHR